MTTLTYVQTRNGLAEALNRVCYGGERIRIARRGKPIAALVSADDLEMLQRADDENDRADARKALAEYKRRPASAVTLDDYLRTRKSRA